MGLILIEKRADQLKKGDVFVHRVEELGEVEMREVYTILAVDLPPFLNDDPIDPRNILIKVKYAEDGGHAYREMRRDNILTVLTEGN